MAYGRYYGRKYGNKKVVVDGITFDSKREAKRYRELLLLERAGEIQNLRRQVKYVLIPTQRESDTIGKRGGIKRGRVIEKEVAYYADFVYTDAASGETVVEDVKGMDDLPVFVIKRKLMLYVHGIRVMVVK